MKTCPRCGQKFMEEYNEYLCPDCKEPTQDHAEMPSLGNEDMVNHFNQDVGLRLQRIKWGHFA